MTAFSHVLNALWHLSFLSFTLDSTYAYILYRICVYICVLYAKQKFVVCVSMYVYGMCVGSMFVYEWGGVCVCVCVRPTVDVEVG